MIVQMIMYIIQNECKGLYDKLINNKKNMGKGFP